MRTPNDLSRFSTWLTAIVFSLAASPGPVVAGTVAVTTITTYVYNEDGAPTAITTQVDDGAASTVYLTWDNFIPDADDPTSGTASAGNGNLAAVGSSPSAASPAYAFDRRDRLVGYSAGAQALTYAYHADGTMASSTTTDGDGLLFYYGGGRLPRMINMRQQSAGLWSAHLGPVRHVSDGNEQILITPRKDVAGEYDAGAETMSAYRYDAFGACSCAGSCTCADGSGAYDIHDNPLRYAGEYRDAIWQGQYLRARWYDAQVPTFVSRDPLAHLNRYGYGDANPVMMTDPAGMKANPWKALGRDFDKAVDWLDKGVEGHFARLFLSPLLYPLEIVAHPGTFWNQLKRDPVQIAFIGISAVAASVGGWAGSGLATIELRQSGIGLAQSVFAGFDDLKSKHFDAHAFINSAESAVGASLTDAAGGLVRGLRGSEGFVHSLDAVDAARAELGEGEFLILRGRQARAGGLNYSNPFLERAKLGAYDEIVVAVGRDEVLAAGFVRGRLRFAQELDPYSLQGGADVVNEGGLSEVVNRINDYRDVDPAIRFKKVGIVSNFDRDTLQSNPLNLPRQGQAPTGLQGLNGLVSNSHTHAAAIFKRMRLRY